MQSAGMNMLVLDPRTGRLIPSLEFCSFDRNGGIRAYREALGQASIGAQTALDDARGPLDAAIASLQGVTGTVDRILSQNPDPTTPNSIASLMDSVGGVSPTEDQETLERRVNDILGLTVVNGLLFPEGTTDLEPLRQLFSALNITEDNCALPDMSEGFLLVTAVSDTVETTGRSTCGDDVSSFEVLERKVGVNISIAAAAEIAGVPESEILVRFYWADEPKRDRATLTRLRALGLDPEALAAVILGTPTAGNPSVQVVQTSTITELLTGSVRLSVKELCQLLSRPAVSKINATPTTTEILNTIRNAVNTTTGANRNRGGTDTQAIEGGAQSGAGRAGDPALLLFSVVDLFRSVGIGLQEETKVPTVDGVAVNTDLEPECRDVLNAVIAAIEAVQQALTRSREFVRTLFGNLGLGSHGLNTGLGFANCLGSINLGLDLSLNLAIGLPFQIQVFLGLFGAALAAITSVVLALRGLLCIPQGLIQLLFGGICGFNAFDFTICPPDIQALVDRLLNLVNLAFSFVAQILSALQVMNVDLNASLRAAFDLRAFSLCAVAVFPVGVALDLAGADLSGQLNVSTAGEG